jgi:hypothetical protein
MMEPKAQDWRAYQLRVRGYLDEEFVTSFCPAGTTLTHEDDTTLLANIQTDQAGIVGLVRHLHNLGCTLIALDS